MSLVLGVSAFYHDSAAALVDDGVPVAAAQQERFSRHRHDRAYPAEAIDYCLNAHGATLQDLSGVAYYEDPRLKARRIAATIFVNAPWSFRAFRTIVPEWLSWKIRAPSVVAARLTQSYGGTAAPVSIRKHHESHAASAFIPSPYSSAAVLCVDGVGEWSTTTVWHGRDRTLRLLCDVRFPHSLGLLYSAFTYFCGFKVDSGEYKLMGLAPYGEPRFAKLIRQELIDVKPDGSFRLNMQYFEFTRGRTMTGRAFERLFGGPRRLPETSLTDRELDLAASVQQVTEEVILRLAHHAREQTGERRLCLAGGVALNCVAVGRIVESRLFDEVWVQPAAGDAGGALGAALALAMEQGAPRRHIDTGRDAMGGAQLGPAYSDAEIAEYLDRRSIPYRRLAEAELTRAVAQNIAEGKVVGWFQGRMEFGPRALGNRSVLGDPRDPAMRSKMNMKIKFRESFRPFAPSVLAEEASDYFQLRQPSPYMSLVAQLEKAHVYDDGGGDGGARGLELLSRARSSLPAISHVDLSARIQTVDAATNRLYHELLSVFKQITGCGVVVNTSFNVRGEPIVNTPAEAYVCFMRTNIDVLVLGTMVLLKEDQPAWEESADWRTEVPLD